MRKVPEALKKTVEARWQVSHSPECVVVMLARRQHVRPWTWVGGLVLVLSLVVLLLLLFEVLVLSLVLLSLVLLLFEVLVLALLLLSLVVLSASVQYSPSPLSL